MSTQIECENKFMVNCIDKRESLLRQVNDEGDQVWQRICCSSFPILINERHCWKASASTTTINKIVVAWSTNLSNRFLKTKVKVCYTHETVIRDQLLSKKGNLKIKFSFHEHIRTCKARHAKADLRKKQKTAKGRIKVNRVQVKGKSWPASCFIGIVCKRRLSYLSDETDKQNILKRFHKQNEQVVWG